MEIFNMKRNTRGFTLIELLVVIAIIALLMGLLLPALSKALENARTRKDQGQLKGIVTSFAIFAESDDQERFPIPGKINRLASDMDAGVFGGSYLGATGDTQQQGRGPQDDTANLTCWLHSSMIGNNFYDPTILISANENNPIVLAKGDQGSNASEMAYDFTQVDPANDTYWDTMFSSDLTGEGRAIGDEVNGGVTDVCHTSYANLALCGQRIKNVWTNGDHHNIILSSRGPEIANAGDLSNDNFTKSPTLELYGPTKQWEGIYASADASAHYAKSLWFDEVMYKPQDDLVNVPDNSFQADFGDYSLEGGGLGNPGGASGDVWMVTNVQSTKTDVLTSNDILYP